MIFRLHFKFSVPHATAYDTIIKHPRNISASTKEKPFEYIAVRTSTARTIINNSLVLADSPVIDFVSLDVEKSEPEVLRGFPFEKVCVRVWVIEVDDGSASGDDRLITAH